MLDTNEQIAKKIWRKFSKEKIEIIKKIPSGFKNRSYFLRTKSNNEYVLKIYAQNYLTSEQIEERGRIVKKLEKKGLPVLEMVVGLNKKFVQEVKINNIHYQAVLSKYIEVPFSDLQVNQNIIITIANELKRLHLELQKTNHSSNFRILQVQENLNSFLDNSTIVKIKEHFDSKGKRSKRGKEFINFYNNEGNKLKKYFASKVDTRNNMQLIHGDFNLNNFLVENGKIIKIFDFDELTIAPTNYEIALSIYYLDYPEEFYTDELLEIFLKSYYGKTKISKETILDIINFMRFRAFYRLARYFIYYQFTEVPGGHFTKFQRHLVKFNQINVNEVYKIINS
jgi:Ser/Thr protein kinase RdoA (MazF antagonist)